MLEPDNPEEILSSVADLGVGIHSEVDESVNLVLAKSREGRLQNVHPDPGMRPR